MQLTGVSGDVKKKGLCANWGDEVWGVATAVQEPEPGEKKSGQGVGAGGDKPQVEEGK